MEKEAWNATREGSTWPQRPVLPRPCLQLVRDPLGFATRSARTYGDVVCLRFGPLKYYMFNHPEAIEYVLRGNHRNFRKDKGTVLLSTVLGQGLVTSEGALW